MVSATFFEGGTAATSADTSAGERTGIAAGFPASDLPAQDDARHDATRHGETLQALEAAILRLEGEIAELGRLTDWQSQLLAAARTDPDGARRLRRPRSSCLKTPLAPFCDLLNGECTGRAINDIRSICKPTESGFLPGTGSSGAEGVPIGHGEGGLGDLSLRQRFLPVQ